MSGVVHGLVPSQWYLDERLRAEAAESKIEAALRELERASDVRVSRAGIIGNVDLILRGTPNQDSERES